MRYDIDTINVGDHYVDQTGGDWIVVDVDRNANSAKVLDFETLTTRDGDGPQGLDWCTLENAALQYDAIPAPIIPEQSEAALAAWREANAQSLEQWNALTPLEQFKVGGNLEWQSEIQALYDDYQAADAALKAAQEKVVAASRERAQLIQSMVRRAGDNQSKAARILGINQSQISRALASLTVAED
ncbi:hypothetical protein AB0N14_13365 [Streptomyces sp. NPDC051104]|uniref:hypothetical protein n=1 Tax=Streptomyces sp. NPDC051104 TaxID=3155044 RepID=UPI0034405545